MYTAMDMTTLPLPSPSPSPSWQPPPSPSLSWPLSPTSSSSSSSEEEEMEEEEEEDRPHDFANGEYKKVVELINEEPTSFDDHARKVVREARRIRKPLNLMNDSVLHEVIAKEKTLLAVAIINTLKPIERCMLLHQNYYGDTPLHIATEKGDSEVARALLENDKKLARKRNRKGETPLHKAVQFGQLDVYNVIINVGGLHLAKHRTDDGSTILHYAIMHDQTEIALLIARSFPRLIQTRNSGGASPLQIMAAFYKKSSKTETLISLIHKHLNKDAGVKLDEESGIIYGLKPRQSRGNWWSRLPGWGKCWIVHVINNIRRRVVKARDEETSNNKELLTRLVRYEDFGFYIKGYHPPEKDQPFLRDLPAVEDTNNTSHTIRNVSSINTADHKLHEAMQELVKIARKALDEVSEASDRRIWEESPLITGVKLGLDDFVIKILRLNPRSATYVGYDGMNVLQAAVKYGRKLVVQAIKKDKLMPPWLFTDLEYDTKNTLLHIAASDKNFDNEADPLRLQDELKWLEMLEKFVPKELLKCRNKNQKTAREVFDEKHKATLKACRSELAEIGRTCSPLLAAVVFTSSFYIPNENNRESNRLAFKIFSHVYVVGFSCAAVSLIMYLLLVVTPYKQQDFRRVVPWHSLMASVLLAMSLAAFIVAFACNMYLQIYGQKRNSFSDLATLLVELLVIPFPCVLAYFFTGAFWRFGSLFGRLTK